MKINNQTLFMQGEEKVTFIEIKSDYTARGLKKRGRKSRV